MVEVDAYIGEIVKALDDAAFWTTRLSSLPPTTARNWIAGPTPGTRRSAERKASAWEGGVRVPGIAYWRGMIKPGRESDELFDLMDLFNTSLTSGRRADKIPTDRYIDGIDQTSFLLADDGSSNREKGLHVDRDQPDGHAHVRIQDPREDHRDHAQWLDIDMTTMNDVGLAPWFFNLYIDPKEQYPVGHRMNALLASMAAEMKEHGATFKKFPPKNIRTWPIARM